MKQPQLDEHFRILRFTAIVQFTSATSVYFELAHVSQNKFSRTAFGAAAVLTCCDGPHRNLILLSLPDEYTATKTLAAIQQRLFEILGLDAKDSWWMKVSPRPTHEVWGPFAEGYYPPLGS